MTSIENSAAAGDFASCRSTRQCGCRIGEILARNRVAVEAANIALQHAKLRFMRNFVCVLAFAGGLLASGELSSRRAPGFSLMDMTFKQHDPQDYRGKILLVEIMKTSCPHCVEFAPILEEVVAKHRGQVAALTIVNPPDTLDTVKKYVAEHKITVPVLFDTGQVAFSYFKATPQHPDVNVPHLFIIDGQGIIQNDYGYSPLTKGIFAGRDLFAEIDRMLAKMK
jgi:peroxiredoxin